LALAMGMSVRRLLEEIDSLELAEWMALAAIEGLGPERMDVGFGQVCATIANVNLKREKGAKPFGPADFIPSLAEPDDEEAEIVDEAVLLPDPEAHSRLILAAIFGRTDLDRSPSQDYPEAVRTES
jgi:hypothetical protein